MLIKHCGANMPCFNGCLYVTFIHDILTGRTHAQRSSNAVLEYWSAECKGKDMSWLSCMHTSFTEDYYFFSIWIC